MDGKYFRTERHGPVSLVRIDNPPDQFFTIAMIPELNALLDEVEQDHEIVVLVFTGASPNVFLSHLDPADLKFLGENPAEVASGSNRLSAIHHVFARLSRFPAVSIAGINGHAWGAGCELALACDLRFITAAENAGIAMLESVLGLTPGAGGAHRLCRILGPSRAFHMLLAAKALSSAEALATGLVHEVLPADGFSAHLLDRARQLTFHTRETIRNLRRCTALSEDDAESAYQLEQEVYVAGLTSATFHSRVRALLAQRSNGKSSLSAGMPVFLMDSIFRRKPRLIIQALTDYFDPEKAGDLSATYRLEIDGKHGGAWTVRVCDGTLSIQPSDGESVDVTMAATASDWVDFITGKVADIELFVSKRMRVYGDLMKALEFESLFL
jgi:enoyl-CoA hydratase